MAIIRKIEAIKPVEQPKLKVAAYARVSTESDNLLHSLDAQISYYTSYIQSRADWVFAGIYSDKGISGTSMRNRAQFQQMIEDCGKGKIDLVLVKSISRFARDTVDCLNTIRHLKSLGVAVHFERENINSLSADGELLLTLLASFAQEESRSISENVKWGIRKSFKEGKQNGFRAPYGYQWDGNMYRIIPEQGEIVKEIFQRYLSGESAYGIARTLAKKCVTGQTGSPFEQTSVKEILSNLSYTGTMVLQKYFINEEKRRMDNKGQLPMYQVEGMYEPLVSKEDFDKAQVIRAERASAMPEQNPTIFSGLITCGVCEYKVARRTANKRKVWGCGHRERKGSCVCNLRPLREDELLAATKQVLKKDEIDPYYFKWKIEAIWLYNDRIEFILEKGVRKTIKRIMNGERGFNPFMKKVYCVSCGKMCAKETYPKGYKVWCCHTPKTECPREKMKELTLITACKEVLGADYEGTLMDKIDKILIAKGKAVFKFKNGDERTWQER